MFDILSGRGLIALLLIFSWVNTTASKEGAGYRIEIQITDIPDSVCYLANYYGDKTYLVDTAFVNDSGMFIFKGDSLLQGGIYIVAGQNNNKYFELIIDNEQRFTVIAFISSIPENLGFVNSSDNVLFYDYVRHSISARKEIENLTQRKSVLGNNSDSAVILKELIEKRYKQLSDYETDIIEYHTESFVATILKAKKEPELASPKFLETGREDSVFAYQSYKKHYWDNLDPADDRLLRTPLYHSRLKNYFEKVIYQHPDTLVAEADKFIERTRSNKETFKYAVWYLTYKFETSKIMGFDEIFVHMVDGYYAKGQAFWADTSVVITLMERADELRNVLIGSDAPNLILLDTAGSFKSLYSVNANYTVILFYEFGCSHCRKEIAALKAWYPDNPFDLQIFAVCTDSSLMEWNKFIRDDKLNWVHVNGTRSITADYHGLYDIRVTPTIYLLDKRKKIIAKRLKTEQMIPFLRDYDKQNKP